MATEFKRRVYSKIQSEAIEHADSQMYQAGANTDTVIIGLLLTNTSGASVTADVAIMPEDNTEGKLGAVTELTTYIIKGAQIPVGSALEVISGKVVRANTTGTANLGDILCVRASADNVMDATLSILENTP